MADLYIINAEQFVVAKYQITSDFFQLFVQIKENKITCDTLKLPCLSQLIFIFRERCQMILIHSGHVSLQQKATGLE